MNSDQPGGLLSELTSEEAADLQECGRRERYERGNIIFHEGEPPNHVAVILNGRVKVSSLTEGASEVILSITGPGDILGEMSAIDEEPRSATASAIEPVESLMINSEDFRRYLETHPRVALVIIQMVSKRLRSSDRRRVHFSAFDTEGRLAGLLVELTDRYGRMGSDGVRIELPLSQNEIAGWIGASREAVNKALQSLRKAGCIRTHRRGITVTDLEELVRRAV